MREEHGVARSARRTLGQAREPGLHETRKAISDARYAAEAARPAVGKKARRISRRMKKMQGTLGDHHDAVVARDTAPDIGIRGSGEFEAADAGQSE